MRRIGWALLAICLAGCAATALPEDSFYSLVLEAADEGAVEAVNDAEIRVDLARIDLPAFLNTRAMALQTGPNQVEVANHHFWAEPLEEAIGKVLVRDIGKETTAVAIDRNGRLNADCELRLEFDRFHGTDDGRVLASGRYWLSSDNGSQRSEFDVSRGLSRSGYGNAVSALRDSLTTLANEIGNEIENGSVCEKDELAA